jgi:hypothetical protein
MEQERINLSQRERGRLRVLHELEQGHLQQKEAARRLLQVLGDLAVGGPAALRQLRRLALDPACQKRTSLSWTTTRPSVFCPTYRSFFSRYTRTK